MASNRERILEVAAEVLGRSPDAGMGEIAAAAGVVRRTVYGHFPTRGDLVQALAQAAVAEVAEVAATGAAEGPADAAWATFVARLWPVLDRYRVLVVLRRGEYGPEIHALLGPVESALAEVVRRGQAEGVFGRHLPPEVLSGVAWSTVFSVADAGAGGGARAATVTSLLVLGVPEGRAQALAGR